ncbi:hypothetical protein B0T18DRAFT_402193 [Schizothecium vesticola]|uniref:Uncharacterized protein n=1 Tax=Schizothecium vesticola TaxID=314040 RepID=A0AA40F4W2_9PEZI|nr:hypothetical protein B0T18DRAFT_402193 [Schizothecium vesticola]
MMLEASRLSQVLMVKVHDVIEVTLTLDISPESCEIIVKVLKCQEAVRFRGDILQFELWILQEVWRWMYKGVLH